MWIALSIRNIVNVHYMTVFLIIKSLVSTEPLAEVVESNRLRRCDHTTSTRDSELGIVTSSVVNLGL